MSNIFSYLVRETGGYIPFNSGSGPISGGIKSQHLWLDSEGAVYAVIDGTVDHWGAGLPFDVNGRLVISTSAVDYFDQKMPFTANGLLAVTTGTGDHYDQGLIHGPGGGLGGIGVGIEWTPNLNGINSYGLLSTVWQSTDGAWNIDFRVMRGETGNPPANRYLGDVSGASDPDYRAFQHLGSTGTPRFSTIVFDHGVWNGVTFADNEPGLDIDGYASIQYIAKAIGEYSHIGSNLNGAFPWHGQIHSRNITDTTNSANNQFINTIINSEEMPTELGIYNELKPPFGDNAVTNGTFDTDLTGWAENNVNASVVDGEARLEATVADTPVINQNISSVPAGTHIAITVDARADAGNTTALSARVRLRVLTGGGTVSANVSALGVTETIAMETVTTAETTIILELGVGNVAEWGSVGDIAYFDNAEVRSTNKIGDWFNLGVDQPYVPVLRGGGLNSENEAFKSEAYNGSLTT